MTKFKKLAVTTASVALSCTAIEANPAQAAVFNYDFTVNITRGFLVGNQYSGSFSYDDASPKTSFGGYRPFDFNFDFEGKNFTESDLQIDVGGYGGFFPNEGLVTASIGLYDFPPKPEYFPKIIFLRSWMGQPALFYGYVQDCSSSACPEGSYGTVTYNLRSNPPTSVPEPSTVGGLMFLGLSSLLLQRKIASSQGE
ncbi:PEP-CTERM sorting domain-containing protein [Microseira sp. BLCC-F43]|jgi:hypothetical protein|uniref:PEP-CTERM sorting domain-containing protein n=1 Tax=Microseira sp. BLCC-F43 TaxID=3153602 RepID=UPI0035B6D8F6